MKMTTALRKGTTRHHLSIMSSIAELLAEFSPEMTPEKTTEEKTKTPKRQKKSTNLVQVAAQTAQIPLKMSLGGGKYAELTEWKGSKRVDLRFWETETIPSKTGVSLSLIQWKTLCNMVDTIDDLVARLKDREPVDWRCHLGDDVYVVIQAPNRCIHVRKHFVPEGEWTMVPTKKGVTLSMYQWEELKKTIPIFEEKEPELKTLNMC